MIWIPSKFTDESERLMATTVTTNVKAPAKAQTPTRTRGYAWRRIRRSWQLYLFLALPVAWLLVFMYYPMYGAQIAFRDFLPGRSILGSEWIGLANFIRFFNSPCSNG